VFVLAMRMDCPIRGCIFLVCRCCCSRTWWVTAAEAAMASLSRMHLADWTTPYFHCVRLSFLSATDEDCLEKIDTTRFEGLD